MGTDNGGSQDLAGVAGEVALGPLDLLAGIALKLDTVASRFQKLIDREWNYEKQGPISVQMGSAGTSAASFVPLWLDLGGPAYGRVWEVRQLLVASNYVSQAVTGMIEVVLSPTALPGQEPPAAWCQDFSTATAAIPGYTYYSAGQFRVRHPNHIWVVIIGGAASTLYQATGDALDTPDRPLRDVVTS